MRRTLGILTVAAITATTGGCAKPCFDDGLDQGGCPAADTGSTAAVDETTESATATMTGPTTSADTTMDPTAGTGNNDNYECPELEKILLPQVPTFQLVVDRSGSMEEDFGGVTRWNAMVSTLIGDDGVVSRLQSNIRFGLTLYSNNGMMCPTVDSLGPQLDAADEITTALEATMPEGDTPTAASLQVATDLVLDDAWVGDKVLVLATDGEPDTCEILNPMGEEVDQVRAGVVEAVAAAYAAGIRTYVISVGPELTEEHLQALANAGIGVDDGAPFWVANDTDTLVTAFDEIVAGIRSCAFDLEMPLAAELAPSCTVMVNETVLAYQDPNGWDLSDENTLELVGTACETIQQGAVAITMSCTCEPE